MAPNYIPATQPQPPLGQLLLQAKLLTEHDLQRALTFQQRFGGRLGSILVRMGSISEDTVLQILSAQLGIPILPPDQVPDNSRTVWHLIERSGIASDWWLDQEVVAWDGGPGEIRCIAADPLSSAIREVIESAFKEHRIMWFLARHQDLARALDLLIRSQDRNGLDLGDDVGHLRELAEEAPVIEFVNNLFAQAFDSRASDIHIEPEERAFHVRLRIDGVLHTHITLPRDRFSAIASRIKLISGLDIAERRLPQDGRLTMRVSGQEIDVRVSSVPGVHGESIVLRLLPKERKELELKSLGIAEDHYSLYSRFIREPHGIILVTGPTGSGKSTTLYATLAAINDRTKKIITVEDPVEYQLPGITQIQMHSEIGYTFARALRAILRQDPDIVMIGEIRDQETAEIAVQAALTGHLVFSTLHTNDAISAFTRLVDMGVEPFLVTVRLVEAQRLVRRLCSHCAQAYTPLPEVEAMAQESLPGMLKGPANWRRAVGCAACQGTGYLGRIGVYEFVELTPEMQGLVLTNASVVEIQRIASRQGFRSLRQDALLKASRGLTTLEEVLRISAGPESASTLPEPVSTLI
jgi:general secretion pathway protein E